MARIESDDPQRILILRFGAIGDVVLASFLIRCLKTAFPHARLDFVVKDRFAGLVAFNPHLDRVWTLATTGLEPRDRPYFDMRPIPSKGPLPFLALLHQLRSEAYDVVVDLQNSPRSRFLSARVRARRRACVQIGRLVRWLLVHFRLDFYRRVHAVPEKYLDAVRAWGVADDGRGTELWIPPQAEAMIRHRLGEAGIAPRAFVALAPGAGKPTKRWPSDRFAALGRLLVQRGYRVVLVGGLADQGVCQAVGQAMGGGSLDLSGGLGLLETGALLQEAALLVSNDTGVMHMATAVGCPVVALFGPTTRHFGFFPFRAQSSVVERPLSCRPCSYHGSARCPRGHFRCMREITPEMVFQAVEAYLTREPT